MSLMPCVDRVAQLKGMLSFDLLSAEHLRLQVAGLYKHSEKVQIDEKNILTWLILNKIEIEKLQGCGPNTMKGMRRRLHVIFQNWPTEGVCLLVP